MKKLMLSQPLYQQAYEVIKESILSGGIKPGSRIVTTKLSEQYQISRTPLREALRQLQKDGLLIQDNLGATVVKLRREDFQELYYCRLILEKEMIKLAVHHITDEQLADAENILYKCEKIIEETPSEERQMDILKLNTQFHETLTNACLNKRLIQILDQVRNLLLLYRANILKYPENDKNIVNEHRKILSAVKTRDEEKAASVIETHLRNDQSRGEKVFDKIKSQQA